jgi:multiple sugar transport system substrate-binding protein
MTDFDTVPATAGVARRRRRTRGAHALIAMVAVAGVALTGCSTTAGSQALGPAPKTLSGTVSLWHYWTDREAQEVQSLVDDFEKANPGVKVEVHPAQDDAKLTQVIASGSTAVDVAWLSTPLQLGTLCPTGGFKDLAPYIRRDGVDMSTFSSVPHTISSYKGVQCSLPSLADAYGLYYDSAMFAAAGITTPPKTLSELEADALKMTTYNADGSIKTLGFNPLMGFYQNKPEAYAPIAGASWGTADKSALKQQNWIDLMNWQKAFVDKIGYAKLKAFTAGLGDEFSANNAFQTGQVGMMMDGEWRVAFIRDQAPNLKYQTAPFPVLDSHPDLYGAGYSVANVLGIAKNSPHAELAWALLKYLTTNDPGLLKLSNEVANIPPTKAALTGTYTLPAQFQTFLSIAKNPNVGTPPNTAIGHGPQDTLLAAWQEFQSGSGSSDPGKVLTDVDTSINNSLSLGAPN